MKFIVRKLSAQDLVASYAEAWIEIFIVWIIIDIRLVASFAEAWIEM